MKTFLDSSDISTWIDLQWVLLGYFNFPDVCWDTVFSRHSDEQFLLDFISDELLFTQIIDSPTHKHGDTLDLIFCSTVDLLDFTPLFSNQELSMFLRTVAVIFL